jgi:hypothetical protein
MSMCAQLCVPCSQTLITLKQNYLHKIVSNRPVRQKTYRLVSRWCLVQISAATTYYVGFGFGVVVIIKCSISWNMTSYIRWKSTDISQELPPSKKPVWNKQKAQRYWVFGLCPLSGFFLNNEKNTTFRKLDLFPSSGEGRHLLCWVP